MKISQMFFDKAAVIRSLDAGTRTALSKVGAFIRTRARSSIRRRKSSSAPGSPPSAHVGKIKDLLFFGYDAASKSVVVGPMEFRNAKSQGVVNLLEFGGDEQVTHPDGKTVNSHYAGNPLMAPALNAELAAGTIPPQWKDCCVKTN